MPFLNDSHCNNQTLGITARSSLVYAKHALRAAPHRGRIPLSYKESQQCRARRVGGSMCKTAPLQHGSTDATRRQSIQLPVRSFDGPRALVISNLSPDAATPKSCQTLHDQALGRIQIASCTKANLYRTGLPGPTAFIHARHCIYCIYRNYISAGTCGSQQ